MKKNFKYYALGWALLLIIFNAIALLVPGWPTLEKATPSFWIGFSFINVAFIGQLVCGWLVFKEENATKAFYSIPLFQASYIGLAATFVVGLICMIITPLPYWVGAIVCPLVLIINIISISKAKVAANIVEAVDEKIEKATAFIYDMRAESEALLSRVSSEELKSVCKKVRDAFKFSDPMSSSGLADVEVQIKNHYEIFSKAVLEGKTDAIEFESSELLALISQRNSLCIRLK